MELNSQWKQGFIFPDLAFASSSEPSSQAKSPKKDGEACVSRTSTAIDWPYDQE